MRVENSSKSQLVRVLDANLEQLTALQFEVLPSWLELYRRVLVAFLSGDQRELEGEIALIEIARANGEPGYGPLADLAVFRRELLRGAVDPPRLIAFTASPAREESFWAGEHAMLLATGYQALDRLAEAREEFRRAAAGFLTLGAKGKALRARFNFVTLGGHIHPEKTLIQDYFFLYREGKKLRQPAVVTSSLLNISREYQKMGALKTALKFANRALAAGASELRGQLYFLAVAHRAHIFLDLGREVEARIDLEEAGTSAFPEVQGACAVLRNKLAGGEARPETLTRSWQERLTEIAGRTSPVKLGVSEEKLLRFLAAGPRDKFELIDHLFGTKIDLFAAENRLKNLMFRIRKKAPGLLVFEADRYFLADHGIGGGRKVG